jgi:hypothetical protein
MVSEDLALWIHSNYKNKNQHLWNQLKLF